MIRDGDIEVSKEIIELHYQLHRTQKILELLMNKLSTALGTSGRLEPKDIAEADRDALEFVQKKFPNMGIEKTR